MDDERKPHPAPQSEATGSPGRSSLFRPLVSWPLTLIALTLALLLVADAVSAWGRHDDEDLEDTRAHAAFFVSRALDRIDASDDQRQAIQAIVATTIDELAAAHAEQDPLRDELRGLLEAETIDREAVEQLRAEHLARADRLSRILATGLADVLEQLSPEQRRALDERLERRRHRRHRRGWH